MIAKSTRTIGQLACTAAFVALLGGCAGGLFGGKDDKATPTVGERVPILSRIESGASVDPALAGVAVVLPPAQANEAWPGFGGRTICPPSEGPREERQGARPPVDLPHA